VSATVDIDAATAARLEDRAFTFVGGDTGRWRVIRQTAVSGAPLAPVAAVDVVVVEEQSGHIAIGLRYLPAVARRLHHGRDLGEPFDFVTWFEFAPSDEPLFDELVALLRASPEWRYVEREVDIRLARA
jgi:hypothetical protein